MSSEWSETERKHVIQVLNRIADNLKCAKPEIGHWVSKTVQSNNVPCCSVCGCDNGTTYEYNYYPNCRAKMEVSQ